MRRLGKINLNRLAVFLTVVECGSMSAAASRLGIAKAMVSAHMRQLELELGASLLIRTTRKLSLTETGRTFYAASRRIVHELDDAVTAASGDAAEPRGTLRVTAPIDYGAMVITPLLVSLRQRYPALRIELLCADRRIDLIADGIDVAIRLGRLADSTHRVVRIGSYTKWLVAEPQFLKRNGSPTRLSDLAKFPFISLSVLPQPLAFSFTGLSGQRKVVRFKEAFVTNTAHACRAAALAGGGLAVLTDFSIGEDVSGGRLVRILPEWKLPRFDIQAVFPPTRQVPPKVRVFIDAASTQPTHEQAETQNSQSSLRERFTAFSTAGDLPPLGVGPATS